MAQDSPKRQKVGDDDTTSRRLEPSSRKKGSIAALLSPTKAGGAVKGDQPASLPLSLSASSQHREIIQLDLDQFYVAASRIRDPSLVGLPIGIKQKGILATASYEARALGVRKLASVKEALKRCPELILVNGEDLSFFRKLSQRVWRLIRRIVWEGKVEKLGMDELFCDVTEMVTFNLEHEQRRQGPMSPSGSSSPMAFFHLSKDSSEVGFAYDSTAIPGHVLPSGSCASDVQVAHRRLVLASHLAAHLRSCILHEIGLTASAGIASNKLLAKLMCAKHKPAEQTVFLPSNHAEVLQYLESCDARAINGFGGAIVNKLRACLGGERVGHNGTEWINGGLGLDPQATLVESEQAPPVPLTVSLCRKAFTAQSFTDLFGHRLGQRLWGLLHGIDHEEVIPAPAYPHQISIEDTFRGLKGASLSEQLHFLSSNLLRRLEVELVEDEGNLSEPLVLKNEPVVLPSEQGREPSLDYRGVTVRSYIKQDASPKSPGSSATCRRAWKRYPLSVRLSLRQGWENRISKQTRMPVEIFDLSLSRHQRADALAAILEGLRRSMIHSHGDRGEGVNLINIAALDLVSERPSGSIGALFASGKGNGKGKGKAKEGDDALDRELLLSLPPDIRREVMSQYGIRTEDEGDLPDGPLEEANISVNDGPGIGLSANQEEDVIVCEKCGAVQQAWLQHDHLIWPVFGLPPCFAQLMDEEGGQWERSKSRRQDEAAMMSKEGEGAEFSLSQEK